MTKNHKMDFFLSAILNQITFRFIATNLHILLQNVDLLKGFIL